VIAISPGHTNDHKAARQCLAAMPPAREVIADKGYDSDALRHWLEARGSTPIIPPRSHRKLQYEYDKGLYKERNLIERTFNRLKDFRRIATRFDRNRKTYMAALCIIAAIIWWL
jgi:transposase